MRHSNCVEPISIDFNCGTTTLAWRNDTYIFDFMRSCDSQSAPEFCGNRMRAKSQETLAINACNNGYLIM